MSGLVVQRCGRCGTVAFPARLLCPCCASRDWRDLEVTRGTVEESTRLPSMSAGELVLASVRLAEGGRAIARLEDGGEPGADVSLEVVGGALVARRSA